MTEPRTTRFDGARRAAAYEELAAPPAPAPAEEAVGTEQVTPEDQPVPAGDGSTAEAESGAEAAAEEVEEVPPVQEEVPPATEPSGSEVAVQMPPSAPATMLPPEMANAPATQGMPAFIRKATFGLVKPSPSSSEMSEREAQYAEQQRQEREAHEQVVAAQRRQEFEREQAHRRENNEAIIRQSEWVRPPGILIANKKGSAGKTPLAIALAAALSVVRGGSVAVQEVTDDPGALALRAEGSRQRGMERLIEEVESIQSAGQLAAYSAPQTSYASVFGTVGYRRALSGEDVARVASVIDTYYRMRVMDSGNVPSSAAFRAAVATADVLVLPTTISIDSVTEMVAVYEELVRSDDAHAHELAQRAIVVRTHDGRREREDVADQINQWTTRVNPRWVFDLPYDEHLAARDEITWAKLQRPTQDVLTVIAAAATTLANEAIQ